MTNRDDETLLKVAERVSDGNPVDWEAARRLLGDSAEELEQLRLLSVLAEAHRQVRPHRPPARLEDPAKSRLGIPWLWIILGIAAVLAVLAGGYLYTALK
jgi:hypothetical protein